LIGSKNETTKGTLRSLLYPLYDAGLKVGHATVTPREAIARAESDLHATTALLEARLVTGGEDLFTELEHRLERWLRRRARALARAVSASVASRHEHHERAGWRLSPDLKDGAGGLRDLHAASWLARLAGCGARHDLDRETSVLLAAREALHHETGRQMDTLRIDLQPNVAKRVGLEEEDAADALMLEVHRAARRIEHETQIARAEASRTLLGGPRRSGTVSTVAPGVRLEDGTLRLVEGAAQDAASALRLLTAAATLHKPLQRDAHRAVQTALADARWDERTRAAFFELLRCPQAAAALEALDQVGGWAHLIPEWEAIRGRAQHDPYHRFTVDAHSFIAVEEIARVLKADPLARSAADEAGDLQPLYLAALLHDIGKGSGIDHSVAGERLAADICERIGMSGDLVPRLVRHHLLLSDTATRRDIDDGAVVARTAETIGDARSLRLLYILSAADGRSTGPEAWTPWKASLVGSLYRKVLVALETGELPMRSDIAVKSSELEAYEPTLTGRTADVLRTLPPSYLESSIWDMAEEVPLLLRAPRPGTVRTRSRDGVQVDQTVITICTADRPGTLARSAGVFALNRIPVLAAQAYSTGEGIALQRFVAVTSTTDVRWAAVQRDLEAVYAGRLALEARVARKALDYRPAEVVRPDVRVLDDASAHSTVVEVRATDALGLLYAITSAIAELDLDIHTAKVDTLGRRVVDVFYVRTPWGAKLEVDQASELVEAIEHRVGRFFSPT
jgi:[protein-PII] uridylyltransferase